jgi:hypothetical protein
MIDIKIVHADGQTCNQFWIYSNFIAESLENNSKFSIWIPDVTICHYPNLLKTGFISFPLYFKWLERFFGYEKYIRILSILFGNKFVLRFCKLILNKVPNIVFMQEGVVTTKKSNFRIKHLDTIRHIYKPDNAITSEVDSIFLNNRMKNNRIIGVHIRRGDYLTFQNGKYFYDLIEYKELMEQIVDLFPEDKVSFFIASNENVSMSDFAGLNCFSLPNSFAVKDLYGLGLCDYIIGPPSTFSAWASLYGDVPLYFIEDIKNFVTLDVFKKIKDLWI